MENQTESLDKAKAGLQLLLLTSKSEVKELETNIVGIAKRLAEVSQELSSRMAAGETTWDDGLVSRALELDAKLKALKHHRSVVREVSSVLKSLGEGI